MENASKKPVGRPKASPPSGPLVLEGSRARMKVEIEVASATAAELKDYVSWVEQSSALATGDALFTTVDFALRDVFRRDRLWQEKRREPRRQELAVQVTPSLPPSAAKAPAAPASSPSSLPPPVSTARPVASPATTPTTR